MRNIRQYYRIPDEIRALRELSDHNKKYGHVLPDHNLPTCSTFGCRNRLSLIEQLAGTRCTKHMNIKPINITSTIKKP